MPSESALILDEIATRPPAMPRAFEAPEGRAASHRDEPKAGRLGALVLTRRIGESIVIGGRVEVVVNEVRSGTVRLMVVAPRSIDVDRREVFDAKRSQPDASTPDAGPRALPTPVAVGKSEAMGRLILARAARQSIMIGEDVEVAVVEVRPSVVKLRISAPRSVTVDRREVFEARLDGPA